MSSEFKHPLARAAKTWTTDGIKGQASRILVVMTTLQLDEKHKSFKADKVKRLSQAAKEWVADHASDVGDVMLISRAKDWDD